MTGTKYPSCVRFKLAPKFHQVAKKKNKFTIKNCEDTACFAGYVLHCWTCSVL